MTLKSLYLNDFVFPRDEGRHEDCNESWYLGFNLISEEGQEFTFICVYGLNNGDLCHKLCTFTDISKDRYFFKTYSEQSDDYSIGTSRLNITYDYFYGTDRLYQIEGKPFHYFYSAGLLDNQADPIILNCTMIDTKGPIKMYAVFLNEQVFSDESNELNYYAQTNILINGTLFYNETTINVSGKAWIDRQWGDILFPQSYEWFAIQLDNEYEIALANIRTEDENKSHALLIDPEGNVKDISEDITILTTGRAENNFLKEWIISSRKEHFNLTVEVTCSHQLIKQWPVMLFFEGSCWVNGTFQSEFVEGYCFSEQNP